MAYQNKFKNKKRTSGVTMIELIVAMGIALLLFNISTSSFNSFKVHSNLAVTTSGIVEAIRSAESSALSGKGDSKWGVKILSNKVVVFKGNSYISRNTSFDQDLSFSGGISASGLSEIIFEKISGTTTNIGTIILTNGGEVKNINVNEKGTITY